MYSRQKLSLFLVVIKQPPEQRFLAMTFSKLCPSGLRLLPQQCAELGFDEVVTVEVGVDKWEEAFSSFARELREQLPSQWTPSLKLIHSFLSPPTVAADFNCEVTGQPKPEKSRGFASSP
mmetsp:Transcript_20059/g.28246  ORF Transcript_20059/g.28246 Transcript_20059/m.28246 type:complete len:120 (-) Transcript_20059:46-405(-)